MSFPGVEEILIYLADKAGNVCAQMRRIFSRKPALVVRRQTFMS